jgi:hypothetical protein
VSILGWLARLRGMAARTRKRPRTARCLREAYSQYTAANRDWLSALRDLTIEMVPHLEAAIRLRFSLQLAYLDRRDIRVQHLLEHRPERLRSNGNLSDFVDAVDRCWSEDDELLLSRLRPEYCELCAMIGSVRARAEETVEGFREHLDAVSNSERSVVLLNTFRHEVERIERNLWSA